MDGGAAAAAAAQNVTEWRWRRGGGGTEPSRPRGTGHYLTSPWDLFWHVFAAASCLAATNVGGTGWRWRRWEQPPEVTARWAQAYAALGVGAGGNTLAIKVE